MSGEMAVSLALKFKDQGSTQATQALQKVNRSIKETGDVAKASSTAALSAYQKLANARETLGVRSEKAIQNEIRQTEAAYKRLSSSGQASARELGRAQDAMRQKVAELRKELEGANRSFGGRGALQTAGALLGAGAAAKMVLQGPVSRTMDYGMELAHSSNTLFAGRSVAERIAGKMQINAAVMAGVRAAKGGVTREDSLLGVKTLGASGQFGDDPKAAFALLPMLTKAAAANDAGVVDMANIAIKAKQNMGLTDVSRVLDMSTQGGIEGQFETRDMAKWLPGQMGSSKAAGLYGYKGLATIIAMNQMAMTTAASPDEAGNNVKNLLDKIGSQDTANDFKKMGIDSSGAMAAAIAKGTGGVDAFFNLLEQQMAKNPKLAGLQAKAKTATGDELKANLQAQMDVLKGTELGKYLQDRQALSPAVAILNDRNKFGKIENAVFGDSQGRVDDQLKLIENEPGAKAQLAAAEAANNMYTALSNVNPLIGAAADGFSKLSQEFPTLAAALQSLKLAAETAGAAVAAGAVGAAVAGGGTGVAAAAGGVMGSVLSKGKGALGVLFSKPAAIALGIGTGAYASYKALKGEDASNWASDAANTLVAEWMAGKKGETIGGLIYDWTHKDRSTSGPASQPPAPQVVKVEVEVKNGNIVASVNEENSRMASRH